MGWEWFRLWLPEARLILKCFLFSTGSDQQVGRSSLHFDKFHNVPRRIRCRWEEERHLTVVQRGTRRPTSINIFVKNTHQSEQLPPKEEVLLGNWVVKAKWLAVSFTSNISLKKIIWAFWRFYMYLRFKINIFKMQLLKNDTANLIDFNCFWSHFVSSFRKSCPLWCVILIKIHFQKIIGLVGHRAVLAGNLTIWFLFHSFFDFTNTIITKYHLDKKNWFGFKEISHEGVEVFLIIWTSLINVPPPFWPFLVYRAHLERSSTPH